MFLCYICFCNIVILFMKTHVTILNHYYILKICNAKNNFPFLIDNLCFVVWKCLNAKKKKPKTRNTPPPSKKIQNTHPSYHLFHNAFFKILIFLWKKNTSIMGAMRRQRFWLNDRTVEMHSYFTLSDHMVSLRSVTTI